MGGHVSNGQSVHPCKCTFHLSDNSMRKKQIHGKPSDKFVELFKENRPVAASVRVHPRQYRSANHVDDVFLVVERAPYSIKRVAVVIMCRNQ